MNKQPDYEIPKTTPMRRQDAGPNNSETLKALVASLRVKMRPNLFSEAGILFQERLHFRTYCQIPKHGEKRNKKPIVIVK